MEVIRPLFASSICVFPPNRSADLFHPPIRQQARGTIGPVVIHRLSPSPPYLRMGRYLSRGLKARCHIETPVLCQAPLAAWQPFVSPSPTTSRRLNDFRSKMPNFLVLASRVHAAVESFSNVRGLLTPEDRAEWKAGFDRERVSTLQWRSQIHST